MKQRKDGRFCAQKRLAGKVVSVYGATAQEAREKLESISAPLPKISDSPTVHEIAQSIWVPTLAGRVSESSASKYVGIYKKHIRDIIGIVPISEINRPVLNRWTSAINSAPAKRDAKTVLRQIFESAIDIGLIDVNPVSGLKVPPKAAKREKALDPEDAAQLLELVSGTPLSFPVFAALILGLRQGEIAGLKWEDLNRQKGELHVRRQRRASPGHGVVESELKTSKSKAVLHLPKPFIAELDARGDLDNLYMTTYRGLPWVPNTIGQFWRNERERFGLGDWHFHDLRHGAAGLLYAAGCDLIEISSVLRHAKPDMSWMYTSASQKRAGDALTRLSELLGRPASI